MEDDEEMSELNIIGATSLSASIGKCEVENCGATGVVLVKASLAALQYYLSHVENYEKMSINICWECHKKVEFFRNTKELALNGDCILSMKDIPAFLKVPQEVIDLDKDDDKSSIKLHPPKKRKISGGHIPELDQVVRKVLKKLNIPMQFSKGAAQLKADLDKLEEDMTQIRNDSISFCNTYNSLIADLHPKVETRTVSEVTIDSDGTVTKKRLMPYPTPRMRSAAANSSIQIIKEIIMLDKEPPPVDEFDEDEIEQIEEEQEEIPKTLEKTKVLHRRLCEVGWVVIAPYQDGTTNTQCWVQGHIAEVMSEDGPVVIEFDSTAGKVTEKLQLRQVAYFALVDFILPTDLRVVVVTKRTCSCNSIRHYEPGIIVENKLMVNHDSKYLVYLDSGECRYVAHKDVKIMCDGRLDEFLKERVKVYPETDEYFRYLIRRLAKGEGLPRLHRKFRNGLVIVLKKGKWQVARIEVEKVNDCKSDVVKVQFENEVEWLFRGSPRFHQVLLNFKPEPKNEYPGWYGEEEMRKRVKLLDLQNQENGLASCFGFEGVIRMLEQPKRTPTTRGRHGKCDETCVPKYISCKPSDQLKYMSPLTIPLHFGWERTMSRNQNVVYVSPCGKRYNNFKSLFEYLYVTNSGLHVDWFCFDVDVDICKEFVEDRAKLNVKDISCGLENIQIRCVNSVDDDPVPMFGYNPECVVGDDVIMMSRQEAEEFAQCCDCTDNCANYMACACRRLTVEGSAEALFAPEKNKPLENWFSYVKNRKLMNYFDSGIFECGERCACKKNLCTNRVVQNGMQWPLIVFKTKNKGWAVRTACDIPRGTFICVYAGVLNTEDVGLEISEDIGAEYLLNLEFLRKFENKECKQGYEADVVEDEMDGSVEHEITVERDDQDNTLIRRKTLMSYFPSDQQNFIINPKKFGNVGRFFSHSCNPNMFLQHVFVHTQDPRFPQHAFFTSNLVKAGSELTWDYKYESDGDVQIACFCGAANCKKRLL